MHTESDELWKPCPPGTFARIALSIKKRGIRRRVILTSAIAVVFIGTGVLAWSETNGPVEYDYGGIWCSEVRQLARGYLAGRLDAEQTIRIKTHLAHCPICPPLMAEMQKITWAPCPHCHESVVGCPCRSPPVAASHKRYNGLTGVSSRHRPNDFLVAAFQEPADVRSR